MKKVTVMISIYQSSEWLHNRIKNILNSKNANELEIIAVNTNSPDPNDHTIPQEYPIKYIKLDQRLTVYETWNHIIQNSTAPYITNANTDDIVSPECYQTLSSILDQNPQVSFAYPSWYTTSTPNLQWNAVPNHAKADGKPGDYAGDLTTAGVGHFPMWRRSLHDQIGLFDTKFKALADAEWWARCYYKLRAKFHWHQSPLGCYLWRNHQNLWHKEINEIEWHNYHSLIQQYRQGK